MIISHKLVQEFTDIAIGRFGVVPVFRFGRTIIEIKKLDFLRICQFKNYFAKSPNRQIIKSSNRQIVKSKKPSREFGTGFFAAPRPGSTAPFPGPFPTRGKGVMGLLF